MIQNQFIDTEENFQKTVDENYFLNKFLSVWRVLVYENDQLGILQV